MKWVCALSLVLCWSALGVAQTGRVYNPRRVVFSQEDMTYVTGYRIRFFVVGETEPIAEGQVDLAKVTDSGIPESPYQVLLTDLRPPVSLPVGKDYVVAAAAIWSGGDSDWSSDSNPFRFSPCSRDDGSGIDPLTINLGTTFPDPINRASRISLSLSFAGPHAVTQVSVDLLGDGQPAWYFVLGDARAVVDPFVIGPFSRPGTFYLDIRARDANGCEGTAGLGRTLTIQ